MRWNLIQDTAPLFTAQAYEIYRQCLYQPSYEKYCRKISEIITKPDCVIWLCYQGNSLVGIISLCISGDAAEILGIAVLPGFQQAGIGKFMIQQMFFRYRLCRLTAETDDEAVGFYQKCGFTATRLIRNYGGCDVERYRCIRTCQTA